MLAAGIVMSFMIGISGALAASDYPTRYIDVVIPYGPGGSTDSVIRLYKDKVEKILGQPIVVIYKPGAAGVTAGEHVRQSKPDGYTIFMSSDAALVTSILVKKASFTLDDFAPICTLTTTTTYLCVKKDSPYKTMVDFIQAAKTKKLTYTTSSAFDTGHIVVEAISRQAGFKAIPIPGGGGAKAMTAVLGGHVVMSGVAATGMESQLRVLATVNPTRTEAYPDVPTLKELGFPSLAWGTYFTLWAPKGTPKEIIDKLHGAFSNALDNNKAEMINRTKAINHIPKVLSPKETLETATAKYNTFKKMYTEMKVPTLKK